jgi:hypothetical protein
MPVEQVDDVEDETTILASNVRNQISSDAA